MPDRHPCETCGTPTWLECRWCGPGCEEIAAMAAVKTHEELAREIVSAGAGESEDG